MLGADIVWPFVGINGVHNAIFAQSELNRVRSYFITFNRIDLIAGEARRVIYLDEIGASGEWGGDSGVFHESMISPEPARRLRRGQFVGCHRNLARSRSSSAWYTIGQDL